MAHNIAFCYFFKIWSNMKDHHVFDLQHGSNFGHGPTLIKLGCERRCLTWFYFKPKEGSRGKYTHFEARMFRKKQGVHSPLHISGEKGREGVQLQIPGHTHLRGPLMDDKHRSAGRERHKNGCTSQVWSGRWSCGSSSLCYSTTALLRVSSLTHPAEDTQVPSES